MKISHFGDKNAEKDAFKTIKFIGKWPKLLSNLRKVHLKESVYIS